MRSNIPLLVGLILTATGLALPQDGAPATNIRAYQILSSRIGDSLNAEIPAGDSLRVLLTVKPEGTAWLVQGGIGQALQNRKRLVVVSMPAAFQVDMGILEMRVEYANARTEGMFTGKLVDREVLLNMTARMVDLRSGTVVGSREYREAVRDTVLISEVPTLEDPNVPVTQGTLPGEGFFTSLVEPLVMLGAVAVAVYLLFTVRS
jgi:hypothetical protein